MFNRTPEDCWTPAIWGNSITAPAFARSDDGHNVLYALDEQVRRHESKAKVKNSWVLRFLSGGD